MPKIGHNIFAENGGCIMGTLLDIKGLEKILDYVSDGIQIIDENRIIIYSNKAATLLDDVREEDIIGKHIFEIYPSLKEETSTLIRVLKTGVPIYDKEQSFKNYKGKRITTVNSTLPIMTGGKTWGAIEISRNITDVRQLSEKLVDLQNKMYGSSSIKEIDEERGYHFKDIIGESLPMQKIKGIAKRISSSSSPVLIYGNTGTGKELLVQAIHNAGNRKDKTFVAQNCAALPHNLLESILFGTTKGSFTDAHDRPGLFEVAHEGTLFLDEINSMPMQLQAKLLRVLQGGSIRRLGDTKTKKVDVRVIAATNKQPEKAVQEGSLRSDLYYRLNSITIEIPDLTDRKEDIPLLINHFINKYNLELNMKVKGIDDEVMDIFMSYDWPGNIRELEHAIEGAMNLLDGDIIELGDISQNIVNNIRSRGKVKDKSLKSALAGYEKELIHIALIKWDYNITKAAKELNIPRQTLQYKISKYELSKDA